MTSIAPALDHDLHSRAAVTEAMPADEVVSAALRAVGEYKREFNRAFECIASSIPQIHSETRELIGALRGLGDGANGEGFSELDVRSQALSALIEQCHGNGVHAQEQARATSVAAEEQVRGVLDGMRDARRLAMTRRRVSLNATVAAEHRGAEGAAYNVLTHALVKLAGAEAETSRRVEELAAELQTVQRGISALDPGKMRGLAVGGGIQASVSELRSVIEKARAEARHHVVGAERLAERIGVLMLGIQRQDILRQGIEHVELLFRDCVDRVHRLESTAAGDDVEGGVAEHLGKEVALLQRAAEVSGTLWESLSSEVAELLDDTIENLQQLVETSRALAEGSDGAAGTGRVEVALRALNDVLSGVFRALQATAEVSCGQVELLNQATSAGRALGLRLEAFAEHRTQAESVHVLMKLESARMRGLEGGAAVADMMREMEHQYSSLLDGSSGLMNRTRQMTHLLRVAAQKTSETSERLASAIEKASAEITGHSSEARGIADRFGAACERARRAQRDVTRAARQLIDSLERLTVRDGTSAVGVAVARSLDVARRTQALLREKGLELDDSWGTHEWQDLVDKFTIAAHKEAAHRPGVDPPNGIDTAGELTLF